MNDSVIRRLRYTPMKDLVRGRVSGRLDALAAINPESRTDPAEVKEEVRKALRRYFKRFDRRPVILPFVMEM